MYIRIYNYGKVSTKNEIKWFIKTLSWSAYVYYDCFMNNGRLPITYEEKKAVAQTIMSFASGERKAF